MRIHKSLRLHAEGFVYYDLGSGHSGRKASKMDEMQTDLSETRYLGKKAFFLFLTRRAKLAGVVLALTTALWAVSDKFEPQYAYLAEGAIWMGVLLFILIVLARLAQTFIEYRGFSYKFDKEFFQVNFGYLVKNEIAIVYHHIQNAIVRRDIFDRLIGVSKLVIVMDGSKEGGKEDIVLPAIDKVQAKLVQKELMRQARIHSVRAYELKEDEEEYVYLGEEKSGEV